MKSRLNGFDLTIDVQGVDRLLPSVAKYQRPRLVWRHRPNPAPPNFCGQLFARIEHEGRSSYFPLGSDVPRIAAAKAREIYSTTESEGWHATCRRYVREITLAIFWLSDPVACTYATLFTQPGQTGHHHPMPAGKSPRDTKLAVIELEEGTRQALARWLGQTPGFGCLAAYADAEEILKAGAVDRPELVLCNRHLLGFSNGEFQRRIQGCLPGTAVFSYGVYTSRDELFEAVADEHGSYFLQRCPPAELLEPVRAAWTAGTAGGASVHLQVRQHFETLLHVSPSRQDSNPASKLTDRECELLTCMSRGFSDNKTIAETLKVSVWTVNDHLKHIYEKLGVHSRTEAVMKFISGFTDRQRVPTTGRP